MGAASIARSVERLIYFMYAYIQRLWNRCTQNKSSHAPFHLRAHQYDNICLHVRSNYQQTKFGTKEHFIESVLGNTGQSLITISRTVKQVLTSTSLLALFKTMVDEYPFGLPKKQRQDNY